MSKLVDNKQMIHIASEAVIFMGMTFLYNLNLRIKLFLVVFFLTIHSSVILNLPQGSKRLFNGTTDKSISAFVIEKVTRQKRGFDVTFKNGVKCRMTLYNNYYKDSCH